mgnify:CR=1 FL=1
MSQDDNDLEEKKLWLMWYIQIILLVIAVTVMLKLDQPLGLR